MKKCMDNIICPSKFISLFRVWARIGILNSLLHIFTTVHYFLWKSVSFEIYILMSVIKYMKEILRKVFSSIIDCISYLMCIAYYPQTWLKQKLLIISKFVWVRNPGTAQLDPPIQRTPQGCNLCVGQGCSQLEAQLGENLLLSTHPWFLQDSVPHTEQLLLSHRGCPPFLATGMLIIW